MEVFYAKETSSFGSFGVIIPRLFTVDEQWH
jgi:hypothetical protein